jgi:phosphoenolpyruvate synthase/pyruvate phosphate dikinase
VRSSRLSTPRRRSSSLLEDALYQPFAGVYATKMIPNNQHDADTRFRKQMEAVKFVYASTFFGRARDYVRATGRSPGEEKMAVIAQEVVGRRHRDRFYPDVSGVARSHSFYRIGRARSDEGVVTLALGLGRTIVDEGVGWSYSPAHPHVPPPFADRADARRHADRVLGREHGTPAGVIP